MTQTVTPLALGSGLFGVNSYLVAADPGFVLVDTGTRRQRARLMESLRLHGCGPDSLRLVLLTHGDFDHIGNAAHLRREFGVPIAMHAGDVAMAANGDMFAGRRPRNPFLRSLVSLAARLPQVDRFEPDRLVDEESDLAEYGLAGARVLLLRGHSAGSIALLLADGSLLSGDVLENRRKPRLGSIMDDVAVAEAGVRRLRTVGAGTVYPGHGRPFAFAELAPPGTPAT